MNTLHFIYPLSSDGHLSYLHFLPIMNHPVNALEEAWAITFVIINHQPTNQPTKTQETKCPSRGECLSHSVLTE